MENNHIQYIIIRKDLVKQMGIGKTAAQAAHASLGVLLNKEHKIIENDDINKWLDGLFTKVVVYVKSKIALLNLAEKLNNDGFSTKLIYDSCKTKLEPEENGTTLTCVGVIPMERKNVPEYLKKLRLLDCE